MMSALSLSPQRRRKKKPYTLRDWRNLVKKYRVPVKFKRGLDNIGMLQTVVYQICNYCGYDYFRFGSLENIVYFINEVARSRGLPQIDLARVV